MLEYIIIVGLWIATIILLIIRGKTIEKNYLEIRYRELDKQLKERNQKQLEEEYIIQLQIDEKRKYVSSIENDIEDRKKLLQVLDQNLESQKQYVEKYVEDVKQEKLKALDIQIKQEALAMTREVQQQHQKQLESLEAIRKTTQDEIDKISFDLEAFRAKQEAINQEILRRRELEEQANFYRICLSDEAISDIKLLQATRQNLKKPEIIDKIIYDNYIAKPVLELIKRVLQNQSFSGIYKITCQETKEIYIGKSTDVKNRWQQHCKTAFNCGTIATSILHRKMQMYGIENFTFELLEKAPKEQLSEREKYYIDFYKTKEVGLNERNG